MWWRLPKRLPAILWKKENTKPYLFIEPPKLFNGLGGFFMVYFAEGVRKNVHHNAAELFFFVRQAGDTILAPVGLFSVSKIEAIAPKTQEPEGRFYTM